MDHGVKDDRNCLFAFDEVDVKSLPRDDASAGAIADRICPNAWTKWDEHEIDSARFVKSQGTMHTIGI